VQSESVDVPDTADGWTSLVEASVMVDDNNRQQPKLGYSVLIGTTGSKTRVSVSVRAGNVAGDPRVAVNRVVIDLGWVRNDRFAAGDGRVRRFGRPRARPCR
jgi:hypothetical protein